MVVGVIVQCSRAAVNLGSGFVHVAVDEPAVLASMAMWERKRGLLCCIVQPSPALAPFFRRNFALVYFYISMRADSLIRNWQRDNELTR